MSLFVSLEEVLYNQENSHGISNDLANRNVTEGLVKIMPGRQYPAVDFLMCWTLLHNMSFHFKGSSDSNQSRDFFNGSGTTIKTSPNTGKSIVLYLIPGKTSEWDVFLSEICMLETVHLCN